MNDDLVSIVIPTHFRNEELRGTLRSIRDQEHSPIEVIVVDDTEDGHAHDVIDEFDGVLYVQLNQNCTAQEARNIGLRLATGEYVQFLDDDDQLRPTKLSKQIATLREHPNAGVAFCGIQYDSGEVHLPPPDIASDALEKALGFWNSIWRYSTLLIHRPAVDAISPLDTRTPAGDDLWALIELARITAFVAVREPLVVVGTEGDRLGMSWAALESRWQLLDRYEPLYDEVDPTVRRHALTETNRQEALLYLRERRWSPRAIAAFARTAYYAPMNRSQHVAELAASLFGRSGHELARRFRDAIRERVN